jgi:hypothetical protein
MIGTTFVPRANASALGKLYARPIVPNAAVHSDDNMLGRHPVVIRIPLARLMLHK